MPTTPTEHVDLNPKLESDYEESDPECSSSDSDVDWDADDEYRKDIVADITLEIGLQERLLQTIESRIQWALRLQESLNNDSNDNVQASDFKTAALDALSAIDAPMQVIFEREELAPVADTRRPAFAKRLRKKPAVRNDLAKKNGKFLYIHLEGNTDPSILRCPICLRTDFMALQGLFNHARVTHALGWTSHDECVRHCACKLEEVQGGPVDFSDLEGGVEVGAATGGVMAGLWTLFEQAVVEDDDPDFESLNRTLGIHADTPALAGFLRKAPVRRGIVVWDPDAVVDIDGLEETPNTRPRWRMPFSHRSMYRDEPLLIPNTTHCPPSSPQTSPPPTLPVIPPPRVSTTNLLPNPSSRFHMATRIIVTDRSLWLSPEQRLGHDTHKWMISVDAPSYAYHITTILLSLKVLSPTEPLTTTAPPFAVIGTAHAPFLARIELAFSSTTVNGQPQKVVLEHWVELDRMKSTSVAHGEEQIVDIELDRGTLFLPLRSGYLSPSARVLWDMGLDKERHTPVENTSEVSVPDSGPASAKDGRKTRNAIPKVKILGSWQDVLKKLVERFPLTLLDIKGGKRPVPALPYKLVENPAQFSALVMGRKKAVEWGRAMAMRDAYADAVLNGLTEDKTELCTADVFSWLHTHGYFPKGKTTIKKEQAQQTLKTGLCRICGLSYRIHTIVSEPGAFKGDPRSFGTIEDGFVCYIGRLLPRRPRVGSTEGPPSLIVPLNPPVSAQLYTRRPGHRDGDWSSRAASLLAVSDPSLVNAVRRVVSVLKLKSFTDPPPPSSSALPLFPINPALSPAEIQVDVAPYAMLAVLAKCFLRAVVTSGLDMASRDRHRALVQPDGRPRRQTALADLYNDRERRMLTPSHICRGVATRGWDWNDELGGAMMGTLARSGVPLRGRPQPQLPSLTVVNSVKPVGNALGTAVFKWLTLIRCHCNETLLWR
ncbi:hypothetical protein R3P38DRAFT_2823836 [Favolaschia claudopus]|uniref:YEATS domain-containing protein n=1 Tax=Favolaschia claudopus TaxID=2862362 RepID=A0AAW0EIF8_9AGAR